MGNSVFNEKDNKDAEQTEVVAPEPPTANGTEVTQDAAPDQAPPVENPHVYRDVADGVKARQSTEAERQARNAQAEAADTLAKAQAEANG